MAVRIPLPAAAATALAAFAVAAAASPGDEPVPVYRCEHNVRLPEGGQADLRLIKSFREDGSVYGMHVEWEDNQGSLLHLSQPHDRAYLSLKWPGEHRIGRDPQPFDWSHGSVNITLLASNGGSFRYLKGEKWKRVVATRDDSVRTYEQDGMKLLVFMGFNLHLVSDLEPLSSPGRLTMALDSLLAWGSGGERLTIYETRVTRRKVAPNTYPTSPAGRHRIVGSYDVDVAALARAARLVREATQRWEAEMAKTWRQCQRTTEGGAIVLTRAGGPTRLADGMTGRR